MHFIFPQDFDGCGGNDDDKYDQKKITGEIPPIRLSPSRIF